MAREGLEPSKPLGRQIYSLLRLTASLPRRYLFLECVAFGAYPADRTLLTPGPYAGPAVRAPLLEPFDGAGGGTRTPDLLITNQLLYRTELRQPDKN